MQTPGDHKWFHLDFREHAVFTCLDSYTCFFYTHACICLSYYCFWDTVVAIVIICFNWTLLGEWILLFYTLSALSVCGSAVLLVHVSAPWWVGCPISNNYKALLPPAWDLLDTHKKKHIIGILHFLDVTSGAISQICLHVETPCLPVHRTSMQLPKTT